MTLSPILQKIEQQGYTIGKQIGQGSNSVIYDIGKNQILKITTDREVAYGAFKLLNKKFKNVYRVFRVMTPKKKIQPRKYYIIAEKLTSVKDSENWDVLYQFLREYDKYKNTDLSEEILRKSNSKEVQKAISIYKNFGNINHIFELYYYTFFLIRIFLSVRMYIRLERIQLKALAENSLLILLKNLDIKMLYIWKIKMKFRNIL